MIATTLNELMVLPSVRQQMSSFDRMLAGDSSFPKDYTVLSVAVITLGLILVVELIRHRLDVAATGRPFFKTVLEGVYRELATLGCVEFFVFLLHKYYDKLNIEQEVVFADVHFTLFFTALFNAFQSCLLAFATTRVSEGQWVRTEQLEVDHYVEIREEFDRVEEQLYGGLRPRRKKTPSPTSSRDDNDNDDHDNDDEDHDDDDDDDDNRSNDVSSTATANAAGSGSRGGIENAEVAFELNCNHIVGVCTNLFRFVRYPHLYRKHQQLLVQIRFHELRIHFLQSNRLPMKFKVSDYLKRSELHVLIKLVHISTFAWLMLLGGVTLLYFFMGIVVYVSQDLSKVGLSLTCIFMGSQIFFVALSLVLYNKMKSIFSTIMRKRLTTETTTAVRLDSSRRRNNGQQQITNQLDLFWGGNPKFIRSIIQFMQFGFAISLSILLVFWKDIDVYYAPVSAWGILLTVLLCYAAFVAIMAQVLPRYTLCTSLGQLVNEQRLQETLAHWQLEEAKRRQRQKDVYDYSDEDSYDMLESDSYDDDGGDEDDDDVSKSSSLIVKAPIVAAAKPIVAAKKAISESIQRIRKPEERKLSSDRRAKTFEDIDFEHRLARSEPLTTSTGTSATIDSIPTTSPTIAMDEAKTSRERRIRERQARRKSQSVGVAMMRHFGEIQAAAQEKQPKRTSQPRTYERRRRSVSGSKDIENMRRSSSFQNLLLAQLVQTDTKELRKKIDTEAKTKPMSREEKMQARRNRRKSVSDGVALMRLVSEAEEEEQSTPLGVAETTTASSPTPMPQHRNRRKCVSAAASIQAMRDAPLSGDQTSSRRLPRSRQSSGGVPRLEPLVEGVQADHSDSALNIGLSIESLEDNETGRSVESQARSSSPATVASDEICTKGTADSVSTLGGHSDANDIPEINPNVQKLRAVEPPPRASFSETSRYYFLSERYRMISHVFGTIACFFFVGMRVEALLIASCSMPDFGTTWHVDLTTTFWMETAWLSCFILVGLYNAYAFRPGHVFANKERSMFVSTLLDIALSSLCLSFLMVAESKRCCSDDGNRLLADEPLETDGYYKCDFECCPQFGSRTYGGLGNIEPFTSLVVLRVIRFRLSKKFVTFLDRRLAWSDLDVEEPSPKTIHPFSPLYEFGRQHTFGPGRDHAEEKKHAETETAVELWMKAIADHPALAAEYGEFSTEILQVMLGIQEDVTDTVDTGELAIKLEASKGPEKETETSPEEVLKTPASVSPPVVRRKSEVALSRQSFDRKYSHLTPEARSIVLAGKMGKAERPKSPTGTDLVAHPKASSPQASLVSKRKKELKKSIATGLVQPQLAKAEESPPSPPKPIGPKKSVTFESKEIVVSLVAPNARLIRSMRRCDRKLLPLLDMWSIVDVVMTNFEIVYFDGSDVEGTYGSEYSEDDIKHIESVRQAVIATKGGKGLRLKDVAMGRKVVGHLELSSADSVHVDRILPSDMGEQPEEEPSPSSHDVQAEFWKGSSNNGDTNFPRATLWSKVIQGRLRIHSEFGTLLLRFYSDLEESERHPERLVVEREHDGPIFKDNALQWCQTIVRLCGTNQLRQKLPHFGDDNDDELRDYIVNGDSKNFQDSPRHMRRKSFGGLLNSVKDHTNFWAMIHEEGGGGAASQVPIGHDGRLSSFGGDQPAHANRRPTGILRRLSSTGDLPSFRDPAQSKQNDTSKIGHGPDMV